MELYNKVDVNIDHIKGFSVIRKIDGYNGNDIIGDRNSYINVGIVVDSGMIGSNNTVLFFGNTEHNTIKDSDGNGLLCIVNNDNIIGGMI